MLSDARFPRRATPTDAFDEERLTGGNHRVVLNPAG